ncbi:MAG: aminotransferase class I/II-fold pyridoxal phosphate-dependent enzyme [Muribaculaceae bacterium]|nr:aminotransferase class I/II-fold pyridoxal phosphate-dependent enzyme [Muribaculaceae bacterium]
MNNRILLSVAHMGGTEQKWIQKAFDDNWITPLGPNVNEFESRLAQYLNQENVVALSAGTAAIHLGLIMLGIKPGDEVICQSFTFAASTNPIKYVGANPVLVDSESETWNMCPIALEEAINERKKVTGKYPAAIIVVHLYGMPAKMDEIMCIANKYNIPVLEDAAEALGSEYKGIKCGTIGRYGALSFNGNKIITTSGGGALICPDQESAQRVIFYSTQARENKPYYYHEVVGYNYRLSNICAGIGCGQMEVLQEHVNRRRQIHDIYANELSDICEIEVMSNPSSDYNSNYWLSTILLNNGTSPNDLRLKLELDNIETRLLWRPMHMQPIYESAPFYGNGTSESLFDKGLCLPSSSSLTDNDVEKVITSIKKSIKR